MKAGKWFAIVLVPVLVGAVIWEIRGTSLNADPPDRSARSTPASQQDLGDPEQGAANSDSRRSTESSAAQAQVARDPPAVVPDSRLAIMRDAEAAASALARAEALERLAITEPALAARKLLELAAFCAPEQLRAQEILDASPELLDQRREWCLGLELSVEAMKGRLEELTQIDEDLEGEAAQVERLARHPYLGPQYEMEEELANASEQNRSDRFTELVRRARDFDEINNLMTLNTLHAQQNGGKPLWRLGAEMRSRLYPQANLLEAQRVAIILFGCLRFGGCASGQYMTMIACTIRMFGECGPGSSLQEHLYLTTTPADYSLARAVLARI